MVLRPSSWPRAICLSAITLAAVVASCGDFTVYRLEVSNEGSKAVVVVALTQVGPPRAGLGRAYVVEPGTRAWVPDVAVGPMSPTNNRATVYVLDLSCAEIWHQDVEPHDYTIVITDSQVTIDERSGPPPTEQITVLSAASTCGLESE